MRGRAALAGGLALLGAGVVAGGLAHATTPTEQSRPWTAATLPTPATPVPDDDVRAVRLVQRAALAASATSYQGAAAVVSADGVQATRVWVDHRPGRDAESRPAGADGSAGGTEVAPGGLGSPGREVGLLADRYALRVVGTDRVAGRAADVVQASLPAGGVAARLWFDRASGLLVRREVFDLAGEPAGSATFETLVIPAAGPEPDAAAPPSFPVRPLVGAAALERLRSEGWHCPPALPAGLVLLQAREAGSGAVHLQYSDGLSTVSLFEQRGALDESGLAGLDRQVVDGAVVLRRPGSPAVWVWQSQGSVFSLVADLPSAGVARVVAALPPDGTEADEGLADRLGPGLGDLARGMGDAVARAGS